MIDDNEQELLHVVLEFLTKKSNTYEVNTDTFSDSNGNTTDVFSNTKGHNTTICSEAPDADINSHQLCDEEIPIQPWTIEDWEGPIISK